MIHTRAVHNKEPRLQITWDGATMSCLELSSVQLPLGLELDRHCRFQSTGELELAQQ